MARGLVKWKTDQLKYLQLLYLRDDLPSGECCERLNKKFGTEFSVDQIYRAIECRGWGKRKKELHASRTATGLIPRTEDRKIIGKTMQAHRETMARFVERAEKGVEKAFSFVDSSKTGKELSAAASAARSLVATYRQCAGMDHLEKQASSGPTYNFMFHTQEAPQTACVIDVGTTEGLTSPGEGTSGTPSV